MKIVPIFVSEISEEGLWSIQLDDEKENEFDKFFDLVNNPQWLYSFFEANKEDLVSGFWKISDINEAVLVTIEEANVMEDVLYEFTERGLKMEKTSLQQLFKPLNNHEYVISVHQKSKARVKTGWLRLYGIRLSQNCYLITGGGVKLSRDMRRVHLEMELKKLDQARLFLRNNGIYYPEDLNPFNDE